MNIKDYFYPKSYSPSVSYSLVVLRVIMGLAMVLHGTGKIQNPMNWMPSEAGVPGLFQFLAAFSEFVGGLFVIVGLLTPLSALGIFFTMAVAVFFHGVVKGDPFVSKGGASYELALVYTGISLLLIMAGPGRYSLDALIFKKKH